MSMSDDHPTDEELEQRLRDSLHDPVPDEVLRISEGLFTFRTIDAELAELEAADAEAAGAVRGEDPTVLTFVVGDHVIEVELDEGDGSLMAYPIGQWAVGIDLLTPSGTAIAGTIDETGVCRFVNPPSGPVQLVISREDGELVKTRWITL